MQTARRVVAAVIVWTAVRVGAGENPPSEPDASRPALADAGIVEKQTLQDLLQATAWPRRAIAAARLERYGCDDSRRVLERLLSDRAWQVRAYAVSTLGRRRVPAGEDWLATEEEPRVLRAALRHHYDVDLERLGRGVRFLTRSSNTDSRLLGAELGAASGDEALQELARETARKVILRMNHVEAGVLSPRLAALTGAPDFKRHYKWQQWLLQQGRRFEVRPAHSIPPGDAAVERSMLARLDEARFSDLETYISSLEGRNLDLAICLDTTASMSGELAQVQGGLDDLMLFVGDVVAEMRVGICAYRDERDEYETRAWGFTADIGQARSRVWELSAGGGGDSAESVYPGLKLVYTQMHWVPAHAKTVVLIGDGPPHVGFGGQCVEMARKAYEQSEAITHTIQTGEHGREVKFFPEIAEAGHGECVNLSEGDSLIAQIAGLTLGKRFAEEFEEFFRSYLELCR